MTNAEILKSTFSLSGLEYNPATFDTFAGWKRRGLNIKKGSKAVAKATIWIPKKRKDKDGEKKATGSMFMKTAHYFSIEQTEAKH